MLKNTESSDICIFLVRHGETDWNQGHRFQGRFDVPLNQDGKDQAHALALRLKDKPITAIYSSPLVRAVETARSIKVFHPSTPFFEEQGLIEMNLGDLDGMEAGRWVIQYPDFYKAWRMTPTSVKMPGGESLQEVQMRAIDTLERVSKLCQPGSTLLLCSHNFVNLTILCYASNIPLDRFRDFRQGPAALNILHKQGQRLWAAVVNDVSHLQEYIPTEKI
jgi:probable phosphoglycerate mutase